MSIARSRHFLVALFLFIASPSFAGALQKAFAAMEVHNYFLARELFQKQVKKHPAAAWYGLSVISGRNDNPFFGSDSAYAFIMRADAAFTVAPDKERIAIGKVGVDHAAIEAQKNHVYTLLWELAKAVNTVDVYDHYVNTYSLSPRVQEATLVRDHMAFQQVRETNTAAAYQGYVDRFPMAKEVYEARTRLQEALYREATAQEDIPSFRAFIAAHPESPYVRQAEDGIYRLSTPGRTVQEYRKFITDNPENHRAPDAWRAIYEVYSRDLSVVNITRFLQEFPDYPFVEELVEDYKTASLRMLPFRREGKWGFIDEDGVERVKAEYEWVEPFEGGQALVSRDGRVGTINRSRRVVVPIEYDDIADPVEGTSTVDRSGHVGAVDRSGELVVPMIYDDLGDLSGGLAAAAKDGLYAVSYTHLTLPTSDLV